MSNAATNFDILATSSSVLDLYALQRRYGKQGSWRYVD